MDKKVTWFIVGYLVGSFFGIQQLLGLFSGAAGGVRTAQG